MTGTHNNGHFGKCKGSSYCSLDNQFVEYEQYQTHRCSIESPIRNTTRLVGEICSKTDECVGSSHCIGDVCKSSIQGTDSKCDSTFECSASSFCSKDKKCVEKFAHKEACSTSEECSWGLGCVQTEKENGLKCRKYFNLKDGEKYVSKKASPSFCSSAYSIPMSSNKNIHVCLPGPELDPESTDSNDKVFNCLYRSHTNPEKPEEYEFETEDTQCSLNPRGDFLCNLKEGDQQIKDLVKDVKKMLKEDMNCHIQNPIMFKDAAGLNCKDLIEKVGQKEANKFQILGILLDKKFGNVRYRDNNVGVRDTLNRFFFELISASEHLTYFSKYETRVENSENVHFDSETEIIEENQFEKTEKRFVGEICDESNSCIGSSSCTSGVCKAKNETVGAECSVNGECDTNQYCNSEKCAMRSQYIYDDCAIELDNCVWGKTCMSHSGSHWCTGYFSMGTDSEYPPAEYICKAEYEMRDGYCGTPSKSVSGQNKKNPLNSNCARKVYSRYGSVTFATYEATDEGKTHCAIQQGDSEFNNKARNAVVHALTTQLKCHPPRDIHDIENNKFYCKAYLDDAKTKISQVSE